MSEQGKDDPCERCGHVFGMHPIVATGEHAVDGGVILCQVKGCGCYATWSTSLGVPECVRIPGEAELADLRARLQTEEPG